MPETILIVDDDPKMKSIVAEVLRHEGYEIRTAMNGRDAIAAVSEGETNLILLDVKLPDISGLEVLKAVSVSRPGVPVVMISGFATIDRAVEATKLGAYDFLEKPLDPQRTMLTIRNALEHARLIGGQGTLIDDMMQRYGVVGATEAVRQVCIMASRVAKYTTSVLITGENGTGKELIAEVIHRLSGRKEFVCFNCAAVPRELIESELFGHVRGSFTGAVADNPGKFLAADGGTLFLDEIADMSPDMQAKILRALETRMITPVGGSEGRKVDVRIIAATNKDLREEMSKGTFREDLFFRLCALRLHIPPLRERKDDILPLVEHFLKVHTARHGLPMKRLTGKAVEYLTAHDWPGNVREVRNVIENAVIFSEDETIDHLQVHTILESLKSAARPAAAGSARSGEGGGGGSLEERTRDFEKSLILRALERHSGNITHAADALGIDRATLSKKIKRYGLKV